MALKARNVWPNKYLLLDFADNSNVRRSFTFASPPKTDKIAYIIYGKIKAKQPFFLPLLTKNFRWNSSISDSQNISNMV
jgi:hypothetical protein